MKIGFCSAAFKGGHKLRGIGYYAAHLVEELRKLPDVEVVEFGLGEKIPEVALVHYPFFDLFQKTLPLSKIHPTVVTIHDVTPLAFPEHYPPGLRGVIKNKIQRHSLRNVSAVITDSEYSKKDISKYLNIDTKKIFPIYLAPADHFKVISDKTKLEKVKEKYNLVDNFVVYVGSVNWNKNLLNLTRACIDAGIDLFLIGKDFEKKKDLNHPELKSFKRFLDEYSKNRLIHILGYVEDEDLVGVLNLAMVLLLPSYYEGFGLPILEAQACGLPVITSQTSSMPEIAGEGALLVDPENSDEITTYIQKILRDKDLREKLVKKGFENVKKFSWEKTAKETLDIYEQILY